MASLTIRNLDPQIKVQLRIQAAQHGHSMEEEARLLLKQGLIRKHATSKEFLQSIRNKVERVGGFDIKIPERQLAPKPIDFDK